MDFRQRYQETFSHVHTSASVNLEVFANMKRTGTVRRLVLIAAAVVLLAALGITACATGFFGLKKYAMDPPAGSGGMEEPSTSCLSLQGYSDSPESQALREWKSFLAGHSAPESEEERMAYWSQSPYREYDVYDAEMEAKLLEIAEKYGITLHLREENAYYDILIQEATGGAIFDGTHEDIFAVLYDSGTFSGDGGWTAPTGEHIPYQLVRSVRGTMMETMLYLDNVDGYDEWQYECQGYTFTLALNEYKGLILADLGDAFVSVNVLSGTEQPFLPGDGLVTRELLEQLAASFHWAALAEVRKPDLDAVKAYADEVYEQLHTQGDIPLTPWGEPAPFDGYALVDGESVPISGTLRLVNVEAREDVVQNLLGNPGAAPEGKEYVVVTLEFSYKEGTASELYLEDTAATHPDARLRFHLEDDPGASDVSGSLADCLYGMTVSPGETVIGSLAFLAEEGAANSLCFQGFGTVIRLDIG